MFELDQRISDWTTQLTPEAAVDLLQKAGVAAGIVQNAADLTKDPQLLSGKFFVPLEHPILGRTVSDASPIKFAGAPAGNMEPAPLLGEDNRYVFLDLLGMSESELAAYMQQGVIA